MKKSGLHGALSSLKVLCLIRVFIDFSLSRAVTHFSEGGILSAKTFMSISVSFSFFLERQTVKNSTQHETFPLCSVTLSTLTVHCLCSWFLE